MEITGTIVNGLGEGALYVKKYNKYFLEKLGFEAFPGTLNLRVQTPFEWKNPILIAPQEQGLFPVECKEVIINNKLRGAVVRPTKTAHLKEVLEIIAPVNIKEYFNLKEVDRVRIRFV